MRLHVHGDRLGHAHTSILWSGIVTYSLSILCVEVETMATMKTSDKTSQCDTEQMSYLIRHVRSSEDYVALRKPIFLFILFEQQVK